MDKSTDQGKPPQDVVRCLSCRRPLTAHASVARVRGPVCLRYSLIGAAA